jgi:hypothetical protein
MKKKSFLKGIDSIFGSTTHNLKLSSKLESNQKANQATQKTTLYLDPKLYTKIKAIAYWERISMAQYINRALKNAIDSHDEEYLNDLVEKYAKAQDDHD